MAGADAAVLSPPFSLTLKRPGLGLFHPIIRSISFPHVHEFEPFSERFCFPNLGRPCLLALGSVLKDWGSALPPLAGGLR